MPVKGQKFIDPQTGDTSEFIETAKETGGKYVKVKWTMKPGGIKVVKHMHPGFDETFEVISGKLTWEESDKKGKTGAGETITLKKGLNHAHNNEENEDLVMCQTFSPALDTDYLVETISWLSANGKWKGGQPAFLQAMLWGQTLQCKTYLASIPRPVQDVLSVLLAPVAKMLGYKTYYS